MGAGQRMTSSAGFYGPLDFSDGDDEWLGAWDSDHALVEALAGMSPEGTSDRKKASRRKQPLQAAAGPAVPAELEYLRARNRGIDDLLHDSQVWEMSR
jgi:hypothetical protein